jgi:poly-beta-1,6-N-acetyl-D-glucosamine synthase
MNERTIGLAIYWGIWLILPALIDGLTAFVQIVQVTLNRLRVRRRPLPEPTEWPGVSIVIPVYNGEATLGSCLASLRQQHYPQEQLEVIVVDNGSTDRTAEVFQEQQRYPFRGQMHWISIAGRGKAYALNAGLHLASQPYLCNVDADTVVHPVALREMVRRFEADSQLGAATGTIEVLPVPPGERRDHIAFLIGECEFQEYLNAFWLGRQGQSLSHSLFTLAGAFSFFRREVLLRTALYDKETVSEDTKVTFNIRNQFGGERLACIPEAIVYVTPTPSLAALYSQRVRWQRGELEVAAANQEMLDFNLLRLRGLALGRTLLVDHTLLFPRLVWTVLFPMLTFLGYPLSLILGALLVIYLFYVFIAAICALTVYLMAPAAIRLRLRRSAWVVAILPTFQFVIFSFRLAGSIIALTAPADWRVQAPWVEVATAARSLDEVWRHGLRNLQGLAHRR